MEALVLEKCKDQYNVIVIGSGAGGFSSADWLYKYGIDDIAIVTEGINKGTSRNTGSDKQTYYKLSLDGLTKDCAYDMACDIASGGCCDGELAYIEAVNSTRCFYRLVEYGVKFPIDEFGGFVGYKTDHDNTKRATSIGPYTSKVMTEKLENRVINVNKTDLLDNRQVIKILTQNNIAYGILVLNLGNQKVEKILANYIIVATGAPACIYEKSVYPITQHGMSGIIIAEGAKLCNFCEWQYGLASTSFRWNVSGSYMQVLPRVISVDNQGNEREFLLDYYKIKESAYNNLFLKGYQWPFDVNKLEGSSRIDMLVQEQISQDRKVFLDFTKNPKGYNFDNLQQEVKDYLTKSGANLENPIKRLISLNSKAVELYKTNGIDLEKQYLEIAVCAQHNNGGIKVDTNYESSIKNLFAVGEVAGVFGLSRQGGTALNSTQVGGLCIAKYISKNPIDNGINNLLGEDIKLKYQEIVDKIIISKDVNYQYIKKEMSNIAGFYRDRDKILNLIFEIEKVINNYELKAESIENYFYDWDMLLSALSLLKAILGTMDKSGSRGGALYINNGKIIKEKKDYRKYLAISTKEKTTFQKIKPVPKKESWFETILKNN